MAPTSHPPVGQRKISNFFRPKPDVKSRTSLLGESAQKDCNPFSSQRSAPEAEPPRKRLRLDSGHCAEVITLEDDSDAQAEVPSSSAQHQPAPPHTSGSDTAQHSTRSASIPARHAGRHMRFQQKLARPSPKEPVPGDAAPKQPFTPLELQIVDLKRQHPGVLLVVEVQALRQIADCIKAMAGAQSTTYESFRPISACTVPIWMLLSLTRLGTSSAFSATTQQLQRRSATFSAIRTGIF